MRLSLRSELTEEPHGGMTHGAPSSHRCAQVKKLKERKHPRPPAPPPLIPQVVNPDSTPLILKIQLYIPKTAAFVMEGGSMQLRPELRFSGGTSGVKSDAEPAAKSIRTWSLTRTHAHTRKRTGEHALTHCREKEKRLLQPRFVHLVKPMRM